MRTISQIAAAAAILCGLATPAFAADYTFATIDVPGAAATAASGINDAGQIVGLFIDGSGQYHGFLYSGGSFTTIDVPAAAGTEPLGINNEGQVVGWFCSEALDVCETDVFNNHTAGIAHGFLYSGGAFATIDVPGAIYTQVYGINNVGQIVGGYANLSSGSHGFVFSNGTFTNIDAPETLTTYPQNDGTAVASGINDAGQIVGVWTCNGLIFSCSFLDNGGNFSLIAAPHALAPAGMTNASGINNGGEIVGTSGECIDNHCRLNQTFADTSGNFTIVCVPGGSVVATTGGVNNNGVVVGGFQTRTAAHGFIATPATSASERSKRNKCGKRLPILDLVGSAHR